VTSGLIDEDGWQLVPTDDSDFAELMTWFPDAGSVNIWGGPVFRYPFTAESFRKDCHVDVMSSYCLRNPDGEMAAFGQWYERDGRGHLARLISNPLLRRQGAGRRLIEMMIGQIEKNHDYGEFSLFVYRDNEPAYRCYRSLGFEVRKYPEGAPMPDLCYFLTRAREKKGGNNDQ